MRDRRKLARKKGLRVFQESPSLKGRARGESFTLKDREGIEKEFSGFRKSERPYFHGRFLFIKKSSKSIREMTSRATKEDA